MKTSIQVEQKEKIFGLELFNSEDFYQLIVRFGFNLLIAIIIVRVLYYSTHKRKDYLFTFMLISTTVFLLCFLLDNVKLELGFALGLFAIFGIIRYRTNAIPIKEMTYLFLVIGLSVINALANKKVSYAELLFTNSIIIIIIYALEKLWSFKHESTKLIIFERVDLLHPDQHNELLAELKKRTGLNITKIDIGRIDYMKDCARIMVYYIEKGKSINMLDNQEADNTSTE
ncbi:MAG: hypothetical protein A2W91_16225 [Bacteroidetes bacterium GWF2_38_335]|nr:MAG: hypothetical protein A2W91_16225 [Bacteroidetes bacterium GWF2_38_335]OFY81236.1 MAG: hypothetical protein A2281_07200 [Bacteroidetes bacterium RIFOXYA12_FULL_38_20]HBS85353.1 DUF4956 domain-containing protein [Bacteroidales bacterium]